MAVDRLVAKVKLKGLISRVLLAVIMLLLPFEFLVSCEDPDAEVWDPPFIDYVYNDFLDDLGPEMEVVFLDVGQGDAALVTLDGHAMLIDGGDKGCSSLIYSVLEKRDITHLDYVINSHPHADHVGGLPGAFQNASVGQVFSSVDNYDTKAFKAFKTAVEGQGLAIAVPESGDVYDFAGAKLTLFRTTGTENGAEDIELVVLLEYGRFSFLFTGDINSDVEKALVDIGAIGECSVLKVAHHGSKYSTSYYFLLAVDPIFAVISVGKGNEYGHPTEEVLSRLKDADVKLFRTDLQGDITFGCDGVMLYCVAKKGSDVDVFKANSAYEDVGEG